MDGTDPQPDLNTGMMIDDAGNFVGGPGDIGTRAANLTVAIERWWWVPLVLVALLILRR